MSEKYNIMVEAWLLCSAPLSLNLSHFSTDEFKPMKPTKEERL
jgi:hypothetical protein